MLSLMRACLHHQCVSEAVALGNENTQHCLHYQALQIFSGTFPALLHCNQAASESGQQHCISNSNSQAKRDQSVCRLCAGNAFGAIAQLPPEEKCRKFPNGGS